MGALFRSGAWDAEAQSFGCKEAEVSTICVVDLNVPGAKTSEKVEELSSVVQFVNSMNTKRNVCLLELPEFPKKTSKRGLADEEAEVQNALWAARQCCDTRWICPFGVHPTAENQTSRRPDWVFCSFHFPQ